MIVRRVVGPGQSAGQGNALLRQGIGWGLARDVDGSWIGGLRFDGLHRRRQAGMGMLWTTAMAPIRLNAQA
jgi:hypothetical protein